MTTVLAEKPNESYLKQNIVSERNLLDSVLSNPVYDVNFLDGKIPYKMGGVSAVIPTCNRTPYDPSGNKSHHNPLLWCLESLLDQKQVEIDNIVVVDDKSTDYTHKLIKNMGNDKIIYMRNEKQLGSSISRNVGMKSVESEHVYFPDDDCVSAPYTLYGALFSFNKLKQGGRKVGAINLPVYHISSSPSKIRKKGQMGKINLKEGFKTGNFDAFPEEYALSAEFLDEKQKILQPVKVDDFNAHIVCDRKAYEKVGGFPDFYTWKNNYAEESDLALRLSDAYYELFSLPDPKFHAVHWRYGTRNPSDFRGQDWKEGDEITLKDMAEMCKEASSNTINSGNRVSNIEHVKSKILSQVVLFSRHPEGMKKYMEKSYRDFVLGEDPNFSKENFPINQRDKIWKIATDDGLKFVQDLLSYKIQNQKLTSFPEGKLFGPLAVNGLEQKNVTDIREQQGVCF